MLSTQQLAEWDCDGFLVLPDLIDRASCDELMERGAELVADYDDDRRSVFTTNDQVRRATRSSSAPATRSTSFGKPKR